MENGKHFRSWLKSERLRNQRAALEALKSYRVWQAQLQYPSRITPFPTAGYLSPNHQKSENSWAPQAAGEPHVYDPRIPRKQTGEAAYFVCHLSLPCMKELLKERMEETLRAERHSIYFLILINKGEAGGFPPKYKTRWDTESRYQWKRLQKG